MASAPRRLKWAVIAAVMSLVAAACGGGSSDDADSAGGFYSGKTITLVVPYDPGGGFDVYARALAPHLGEALGAEVKVENMPGGGGLIGANRVYNSKNDGLTIGLVNFPGTVFAALTGKAGVDVDPNKWTFLGRIAAVNPVVYTGEETDYTDAASLLAADEPVTFGIGGVGSDAYYAIKVVSEALDFPVKIIAGYPGSEEADAALLAGEVEGGVNSVDSALETIENSGAHPIMVIGAEPNEALPEVPAVTELTDSSNQGVLRTLASVYDLERVLVAPPGVPASQADQLADAVAKASENPDFVAAMEEEERILNPLDAATTREMATELSSGLASLEPLLADS